MRSGGSGTRRSWVASAANGEGAGHGRAGDRREGAARGRLRLLTGRGRYVEDVAAAGEARGYVAALAACACPDRRRSTPSRARAAPGVLAVLTGAELRAARARHAAAADPAPQAERRAGLRLSAAAAGAGAGALCRRPRRFRRRRDPEPGEGRRRADRRSSTSRCRRSSRPRRRSRPARRGVGRQSRQRGLHSRGRRQGGGRRRLRPRRARRARTRSSSTG